MTSSHVRIVNAGTPEVITAREALDEIEAAMIGATRKDVRQMSAARSTANIHYRDGRTVHIRPATAEEIAAVKDEPTEPIPVRRTLKGFKTGDTVTVWCHERPAYQGATETRLSFSGDPTAPAGEPISLVITRRRNGSSEGLTPDGRIVDLYGSAAKLWIAA